MADQLPLALTTGCRYSVTGSEDRGALLSPCGIYRYQLWRMWDPKGPRIAWVMLNPSTADATQDDPTIRRCVAFARAWGFGDLVVVNLFALRATDPRELRNALTAGRDPVGPDNDLRIMDVAGSASAVVAAWGVHGALAGRDREVQRLLHGVDVQCLGTTRDGHPRHPLYLATNTPRMPYRGKNG